MKTLLVTLSLLFAAPSMANEEVAESTAALVESLTTEMQEEMEGKGPIKSLTKLPLNSLNLVETKTGESYFISSDGRFVVMGRVFDNWSRSFIETEIDAKRTMRIPLDAIGVDPAELASFYIGDRSIELQATVFVDPTNERSQAFIKEIINNPNNRYIRIVIAPVNGHAAGERAKAFWCAEDRAQAIVDLAYGTSRNYPSNPHCDLSPLARSMMVVQMLNMPYLPYFFRDDGLTHIGIPVNYDEWLAQP
ncbi:hypothetical protein IC617_08230 [Neiella sp. HB171785]|uniref:DsbC family protein n=1 Tax=Neiella litorisoli TaxID=2771431 RepID=A0A8J6QJR0_9GAMM|nr:hypothetical protein [Neiella litorisoli]MBD1389411.1 hypothetical protein [Neiella litorisoli]